jgi:chemotaxis-related protein WspD
MTVDRFDTALPAIDDCWNRIGVHGDRSCPALVQHVHCRNCPVYSAAALLLLDRDIPVAEAPTKPALISTDDEVVDPAATSVVIFRVGAEWLALPTAVVSEVAELRPIHSLPHRRNGFVLGVTNGRGELLPCVALARMLGIEPSDPARATEDRHRAQARLLVIRRGQLRAACPVEDIHGVHRFRASDLKDRPATVARTSSHTSAVATWRDRTVGVLDEGSLFAALERSLA